METGILIVRLSPRGVGDRVGVRAARHWRRLAVQGPCCASSELRDRRLGRLGSMEQTCEAKRQSGQRPGCRPRAAQQGGDDTWF